MPLELVHSNPSLSQRISLFYNGDKISAPCYKVINAIVQKAIEDATREFPQCSICMQSYNIIFAPMTLDQLEAFKSNLFNEIEVLRRKLKNSKKTLSESERESIQKDLQQAERNLAKAEENEKMLKESMNIQLILLPCSKETPSTPTLWERFTSFFYRRNITVKNTGNAHHIFCSTCIRSWIFDSVNKPTELKNRTCPICRYEPITAEDLLEESQIPEDLKAAPTTYTSAIRRQARSISRAVKPAFILVMYFSITMLLLKMKINIALQMLQLFIIAVHARRFFS